MHTGQSKHREDNNRILFYNKRKKERMISMKLGFVSAILDTEL